MKTFFRPFILVTIEVYARHKQELLFIFMYVYISLAAGF